MYRSKMLYSFVVGSLLAFSNAADAQVATAYNFGTLLTASAGYSAPKDFEAHPFAHLDAVDSGNVWTFTLTINNNLFSYFGDNAFIGSMSFDFTPDPASAPVSSLISSNVGGVTSVLSTSGTGLSGLSDIDFGTQFGKGSKNRLSQNDYVTWRISGTDPASSLTNMYVHVQGITGGYSAKYTPLTHTPPPVVPEPETYAMMLAGLGLLGIIARRRKQNA
ncbi:MAG: FxDxF family PEP-CTERM protein [Nitrosomonadales bacterium]|nr:FxDxF family PEP-CTERM protein [Nitrosomonadales bacterium]